MPVGKRDFNLRLRKKLEDFLYNLKKSEIKILNKDFRDINLEDIEAKKSFLYLDPPYLLGQASYNENNMWTEKDEKDLLKFLKKCDKKKIRFALSNVIEHKGRKNKLLMEWIIKNNFNINYIRHNYYNSNYQVKSKNTVTKEVLITNY